jgi:poly-gamma-glutamate synthesis protein (capsule biosynthesis protein)
MRGQQSPARDWTKELQTKISEPFTFVSVGDILQARPLSEIADPGLQAVIKIVRDADVAMGNFEYNIRDERHYTGPVMGFSGPKEVAPDVKAMGFDIVSRANNHAFDGGEMGYIATNDLLEAAGVAVAGSGRNLDEARAARFIETPKGRVGLVAMHTPEFSQNGPTHMGATRRVGTLGGRPGMNILNVIKSVTVTPEQLAMLKKIRDSVYEHRSDFAVPIGAPAEVADEVVMFANRFKAGSTPGLDSYEMNQEDLQDILENIRNAKEYAHFMAVSIHTHQNESDLQLAHQSEYPPDFLITLARATIDNGADAFIGHGPHILRGMEIYKGKPIFYGLGEFVQDLHWPVRPFNSHPGLTNAEAATGPPTLDSGLYKSVNLESVVAVSRYDKGQLREVRLYPIDGRADGVVAELGHPRLSPPAIARTILERLQKLSAPFNTKIAIEGNVGIIRVAAGAAPAARGN